MSRIKIYMGNPTAGGTDGTLVSSGTGLNPIASGQLKVPEAGFSEGAWIKLALRCDTGFITVLDTARHARVTIVDSTSVDKWQLAPDVANAPGTPMTWGAFLDFVSAISAVNTIFWVRARVASTEEPMNDVSVSIVVNATVGAV